MISAVAVYLHGDDLVPDVVTEQLGVAPTKSWCKGQERDIKTRKIKSKTGLWQLKLEAESSILDDYVSELVEKLRLKAVQNVLEIPGVDRAVFDVLYIAEAAQLSHTVLLEARSLRRISDLGLSMTMNFGILSEDDNLSIERQAENG